MENPSPDRLARASEAVEMRNGLIRADAPQQQRQQGASPSPGSSKESSSELETLRAALVTLSKQVLSQRFLTTTLTSAHTSFEC